MQTIKAGRGGVRPNAGRPAISEEEKQARKAALEKVLIDELIFPAVCTAFHADPGRWQERILTFELSGTQIRLAYGAEGLKEWKSYFTQVRRGGCDQDHNGYATLWRFNTGKYGFILKLVQALGHSIKDLPKPGFPPVEMLKRLDAVETRREKARAKKAKAKANEIQATVNAEAAMECLERLKREATQ